MNKSSIKDSQQVGANLQPSPRTRRGAATEPLYQRTADELVERKRIYPLALLELEAALSRDVTSAVCGYVCACLCRAYVRRLIACLMRILISTGVTVNHFLESQ